MVILVVEFQAIQEFQGTLVTAEFQGIADQAFLVILAAVFLDGQVILAYLVIVVQEFLDILVQVYRDIAVQA